MRTPFIQSLLLSTLLACSPKHSSFTEVVDELEIEEEQPLASLENESQATSTEEATVSSEQQSLLAKQTSQRTTRLEMDKNMEGGEAKPVVLPTAAEDRSMAPEEALMVQSFAAPSLQGAGGVSGNEVQSATATLGTKGIGVGRGKADIAPSTPKSAPAGNKVAKKKEAIISNAPTVDYDMAYDMGYTKMLENTVIDGIVDTNIQTSGEEYTDYGINPFTLVSEDALSTFSIDVDTASYTIARRKLNEGTLPNYASVRTEEFINFFDYDYAQKETSINNPFHVDTDLMKHPFKEDRHILRVGLQGMAYTVDTRPPLHLTFLVDVSGSMSSSDKLPLAQEAMHMLVDTLREDDTVALATYAGNISKILSPTYGDNKKSIHAAIDRLNANGSTAMSSGLDLAYEMAWASFEPGAENRVMVLSDGDANVGRTGWEDMLSQIKSYADRGVTMSTIGFGMGNYKDTRMEQLANKGDGNNFYIDGRAQAHRVFVEDFNSTMLSIARDVKIQVEFEKDIVQSYRLIGYENRDIADKDFRNDRVDAGEVGSGHTVTALYELVLKDEVHPNDTIATTRVRYEKPGPDSIATERSWNTTAKRNSNTNSRHATEVAFAAASFGEILRRSPYVGEMSIEDLIGYTKDVYMRGNADEKELLQLMETAKSLSVGPSLVSR